ncbi:MAG: PocR ligand-binding domain-containing protein [Lachnospiraceae bacterium]
MHLIYDMKEINTLLTDLHHITGFRIALFDSDFTEIMSYPSRLAPICNLLRNDDALLHKCKSYDKNSFLICKESGKIQVYECHAGFTEIIIPIHSESTIIAYIMCGQICATGNARATFDALYHYLRDYDLDLQQIQEHFQDLQETPYSKINAIAHIISLSASYLYQSQKIKVMQNSFSYQIDSYIIEHITEDLDVESLCEHFHYHKTKFYELTNQMYGVGIKKHVRQLRVQVAKNLLATTDFSISEIASQVGIHDYNYFTKVFKEEAFCTPREYRKNNIVIY